MIIDSHHHLWWMQRHDYRWPPQAGDRLDRDFTTDDLRREIDASGIEGTVLIQVLPETGETGEYLDIQRSTDFIRGVVGWVPLVDPPAAARALDDLRGRGKLVGIRHLISNEPDPAWLLQPAVLESLAQLARQDLAFDAIPVNPAQFESVIDVAQRLPDLRIVINHLGRPPLPEQGWEPWASLIARAAACPNTSVKLSAGLDIVMRWQWSTDAFRRYVDHVVACFGPDRIMAASNWPVVLLGGSFAEVWSGITELVAGLSASERAAILGGTAGRIYKL
jgi:L-fuconolactonase